ncbi:hypothetical protein ACFX2I_042420 [Malus domestica]
MTRQPLNLLENLHKTLLQFLNPFTASLSQARQARAQILKTASPTTLISQPSSSLFTPTIWEWGFRFIAPGSSRD